MEITKPTALYTQLEGERQLCRDLMGGTEAMRDGRTEYLPMEDGESPDEYESRLARTFLYNGFKRTVQSHAGKVFDRAVHVDGPDVVLRWCENISNDGRGLTLFARSLMMSVLSEGIAFIQVEYPKAPQVRSKADEKQLQLRPYLIEVPPEALFYWRWRIERGIPIVEEVRIMEMNFDDEGKEIQQVRQLTPGAWVVWQQVGDAKTWTAVEEGTTAPIVQIPIIPIYAERDGVYQSSPPLRDLADLNLAHWQSSSDQRHVLHVARVPVLFGAGLAENMNRMTIGPNRMIKTTNPDAKLMYVEHSGAAIDAGRQDLLDLERRMGTMGLELLVPDRPGDQTATEKAIEKAESESALQMMAKQLQDGLQQAIDMMMKWGGVDGEAVVDLNTSFEIKLTDQSELATLTEMRMNRDLSQESYWHEMKRRGVLADDFDPEYEMEILSTEGPKAMDLSGTVEGEETPPQPVVVQVPPAPGTTTPQ